MPSVPGIRTPCLTSTTHCLYLLHTQIITQKTGTKRVTESQDNFVKLIMPGDIMEADCPVSRLTTEENIHKDFIDDF